LEIELKELASIQTGIYAKPSISGEVIYLQSRHFNSERKFDRTVSPDLRLDNKIEKHLLKNGDIIVASKGFSNFAVVYNESIGPAVASSTFLVVKNIQTNLILPEFLEWFLNLPQNCDYFQNNAKGTSLPSIGKTVLENLKILLPDLEKQKIILEIGRLRSQADAIKTKIQKLQVKVINHYLISSIK
jgi:restriction endonuclease S subunit